MTEKTVDVYEDKAVVEDMVARYVAAGTAKTTEGDAARAAVVAELAEELGKSEASVRGKLDKKGVYIAKTRTTKSGKAPVSKNALADRIADHMGYFGVALAEAEVESLTKATKRTLEKIEGVLADLIADEVEVADETSEEAVVEAA